MDFHRAVRALPGHQIWSQPYKKDAHIFMEVAEGKITLDEFVTQMTDEELAHILGGQPEYRCGKYIWIWKYAGVWNPEYYDGGRTCRTPH